MLIAYLKPTQHQTDEKISDEKEYLFVLVSSVCATVLVVLFIFIFLLNVKKRKRSRNMEKDNKTGKGYLSRSLDTHHNKNEGVDNAAFTSENGENQTIDVSIRIFLFHILYIKIYSYFYVYVVSSLIYFISF